MISYSAAPRTPRIGSWTLLWRIEQRIYGLNYKDERADGIAWLARFGDPYQLSAYDRDGRIGIDYGVYGVPETYVIDKAGVIRYKRIGIVTPEIVREKILPLVKELNGNG